MSYAISGLGLSVYYPPGTPQNPTPPETPPPPPKIEPPPPPPPTTRALVEPPTGWWGAQSPTVQYALVGGAAILVIGAVVSLAK